MGNDTKKKPQKSQPNVIVISQAPPGEGFSSNVPGSVPPVQPHAGGYMGSPLYQQMSAARDYGMRVNTPSHALQLSAALQQQGHSRDEADRIAGVTPTSGMPPEPPPGMGFLGDAANASYNQGQAYEASRQLQGGQGDYRYKPEQAALDASRQMLARRDALMAPKREIEMGAAKVTPMSKVGIEMGDAVVTPVPPPAPPKSTFSYGYLNGKPIKIEHGSLDLSGPKK